MLRNRTHWYSVSFNPPPKNELLVIWYEGDYQFAWYEGGSAFDSPDIGWCENVKWWTPLPPRRKELKVVVKEE